jgi:4-diphosphocytidyl-2-C-methyl-D-erythritol kinase
MSAETRSAPAPAKVNLSLVVGPLRTDGKHDVATVLQRLELADEVAVWRADTVSVDGFGDDTLVTAALAEIRRRTGVSFGATIRKEIPVAAGLGGGSSDAATALALANELLPVALPAGELHQIAAGLGSDVPFFLADGPQLGLDDGTRLEPCSVPGGLAVVLALPHGVAKASTAAVYAAFDERHGARGFEERRARLLAVLDDLTTADDLARLPRNDLASSPLGERLEELGAIRADVSGAGPVVYGVFADDRVATSAAAAVAPVACTWVTRTSRQR